jgi:hypothetical protein
MKIGDMLINRGIITTDQLKKALEIQGNEKKKKIGEILNDLELVDLETIQEVLELQRTLQAMTGKEDDLFNIGLYKGRRDVPQNSRFQFEVKYYNPVSKEKFIIIYDKENPVNGVYSKIIEIPEAINKIDKKTILKNVNDVINEYRAKVHK